MQELFRVWFVYSVSSACIVWQSAMIFSHTFPAWADSEVTNNVRARWWTVQCRVGEWREGKS